VMIAVHVTPSRSQRLRPQRASPRLQPRVRIQALQCAGRGAPAHESLYQSRGSVMACCAARTLHASGRRASTFSASTTMSPPTIAFVVAIAWMMLPAMPCARAARPITPGARSPDWNCVPAPTTPPLCP